MKKHLRKKGINRYVVSQEVTTKTAINWWLIIVIAVIVLVMILSFMGCTSDLPRTNPLDPLGK